ncbi:MAG: hypothetical protein ALMCE001_11300 [Methanocorpusculum sp. MCE]|nr:MAG: hypothetical protein ALMCE001_11300 [Methanocorpusculum sp. MCE]
MKSRPEAAISPTIGVILLIFLTRVLIGAASLVFFGFADDITEAKQAYITAETTDNPTNPLVLRVWDIGDGTVLIDLVVSVNTPDGISIGTPTKISNVFYAGETIPIEFDNGFPKGSYLVTVTGEFADGTEQILFIRTMNLEAVGNEPVEVSDKVFLAIRAIPNAAKSRNITIYDQTADYTEIDHIVYWKLEYGDGHSDIFTLNKSIYTYRYATEAFDGQTYKAFTITYTAFYNDNTKTTVTSSVNAYNGTKLEEDPTSMVYYLKEYKLNGYNGLLLSGDIDLRGVLSETMWKSNVNRSFIQINIDNQSVTNLKKGGASVDSWIFETNGAPYSTHAYGYADNAWKERATLYRIAFNNDTIPNSLTITIKLINTTGIVLPSQTTTREYLSTHFFNANHDLRKIGYIPTPSRPPKKRKIPIIP